MLSRFYKDYRENNPLAKRLFEQIENIEPILPSKPGLFYDVTLLLISQLLKANPEEVPRVEPNLPR